MLQSAVISHISRKIRVTAAKVARPFDARLPPRFAPDSAVSVHSTVVTRRAARHAARAVGSGLPKRGIVPSDGRGRDRLALGRERAGRCSCSRARRTRFRPSVRRCSSARSSVCALAASDAAPSAQAARNVDHLHRRFSFNRRRVVVASSVIRAWWRIGCGAEDATNGRFFDLQRMEGVRVTDI